ncbi:hypothetical protein FJZ31_42875 [Candidatus Poribacteria bacterium]|nr:hypothetical protein [Candidatus Poribacteria bacterium]
MNLKSFVVILLSLTFVVPSIYEHKAYAFIERNYTLPEIIEACTNIVFGKVKTVNTERFLTIIVVDEDVAGKSGLSEIKINLSVGQIRPGTSPDEMIRCFKPGAPIVIFYDKHYGQLNSIGYVNGKWFQCKTFVGDDPQWTKCWWNFTHIEIYLQRTFSGRTEDLQKTVRKILKNPDAAILARPPGPTFDKASKADIKILVLSGIQYRTEFRTLCRFRKIGEYQFAFQETTTQILAGLNLANILWIGQGAIREAQYFLSDRMEKEIKNFVKNGGVVIVSGQDNDFMPDQIDWLPESIIGVQREETMDFEPTKETLDLFKRPNKIMSGQVYLENSWCQWSKKYTVLATTNNGFDMAFGMLKYGNGMYLLTSLHNETFFQVATNRRIMENLIYFAARWLKTKKR